MWVPVVLSAESYHRHLGGRVKCNRSIIYAVKLVSDMIICLVCVQNTITFHNNMIKYLSVCKYLLSIHYFYLPFSLPVYMFVFLILSYDEMRSSDWAFRWGVVYLKYIVISPGGTMSQNKCRIIHHLFILQTKSFEVSVESKYYCEKYHQSNSCRTLLPMLSVHTVLWVSCDFTCSDVLLHKTTCVRTEKLCQVCNLSQQYCLCAPIIPNDLQSALYAEDSFLRY